jgi:long-chain acyl-CoA synthetase
MTTSSAASRRAALIEWFAAPGQPPGMGERTVRGVPIRVYMTGPLTLRDIALASTGAADRPFLICRDERWSYAGQARIIAGLARCPAGEYGLRKGDRVAVCMRNYPEWTLVVWAAQVTGLVLVPLNVWWTVAQLRYALAHALVSLPRAQSGKVLKRDLRSAVASELRDG